MSNLLRRVRKLETRLTDVSGLAPDSRTWLDYWTHRIERLLAGEPTGRIPLEAIDALVVASTAREERPEKDLAPVGG
ncbi:MAG: hypothetical protein ABSH46_20620 [Bryobacteraceae bacterium]|jgi:hypothetical protein